MSDNTTLPGTGDVIATDDIGGVKHQLVKIEFGAADSATPVSAANPLPVVFATAPTTPVTGSFWQTTQPVSFSWAGLTDTQLRATALPVSGTFFQATQPVSIAASVAVTGPATDAQLRATALPVSLASTAITGSVAVTGPLTDAQLRASAVPVSLASTTITGGVVMADALANPTATQVAAGNMLFNGTSWDRERGMSLATTTGDTGAKTATGSGATTTNVGSKGLQIVIVLGAVSGTVPTAVFKVQSSVDGGTNWVDVPGAATASLVASGTFGISIYPGQAVTAGTTTSGTTATANGVVARTWRVVWTIGGTTPSFTITSITYNYLPN